MPPTAAAQDRATRYAALHREEAAERIQAERDALDERELRLYFEAAADDLKTAEQREHARIEADLRERDRIEADFEALGARIEQAGKSASIRAYLAPEAVAARKAESDRRRLDLDNRLYEQVSAAETKRLYDPAMRREFDAQHAGGAASCACRGHRLLRREIGPGAPYEAKTVDLDRAAKILAAEIRLAEATAELVRRGIPVPTV